MPLILVRVALALALALVPHTLALDLLCAHCAQTGAGGSDGKGVGGGNPIAGNESELEAAGKLRHWVCLNCKYIGKTTSDKLPKQHTASIADRSVGTDKRNHGKSDGGFIWQTCSCTGRCECD